MVARNRDRSNGPVATHRRLWLDHTSQQYIDVQGHHRPFARNVSKKHVCETAAGDYNRLLDRTTFPSLRWDGNALVSVFVACHFEIFK